MELLLVLLVLEQAQLLELELVLPVQEQVLVLLLELVRLLLIHLSYKRKNRIRVQQQLTKQVFFSFHSPFSLFILSCFSIKENRKIYKNYKNNVFFYNIVNKKGHPGG